MPATGSIRSAAIESGPSFRMTNSRWSAACSASASGESASNGERWAIGGRNFAAPVVATWDSIAVRIDGSPVRLAVP